MSNKRFIIGYNQLGGGEQTPTPDLTNMVSDAVTNVFSGATSGVVGAVDGTVRSVGNTDLM